VEEQFRDVALPLLRFGAFSTHAVLFGLVPVILLVLRPAFARLSAEWDEGRSRLSERLEGVVGAALIASVLTTLLILLLQSALFAEIADEEVTSESFFSVLETSNGQWIALRLPLAVALAVLVTGKVRAWALPRTDASSRPTFLWWTAWAALGIGLLATATMSGHSRVASPQSVALANDLSHQAVSATWFAGVILLAVLLPDGWLGRDQVDRLELLSPTVTRFSRVAFASIALAGITGVVNSLLHIDALNDLWDSGYGRTVGAKLVLFGGILALGGVNHYFVREKLRAAHTERRPTRAQGLFRRTIAAELAIAISVMGATGLLVGLARTKPIEDPDPGSRAQRVRIEESRSVRD
jgi:putative copper export protein